MSTQQVVILETNTVELERLRYAFETESSLRVVGALMDGTGALEKILSLKPDAVVLNPLLPNADMFEIIREMRLMKVPPVIVCLSEFYSRTSVRIAQYLGVDYFLFKPSKPSVVVAAVKECLRVKEDDDSSFADAEPITALRAEIHELLWEHNFSPRYLGTELLAEAILRVKESPMKIHNLASGLYRELALRSHTTPTNIERNIRTAITSADEDQMMSKRLHCPPTIKNCIQYFLGLLRR